jgi:hypothetical protein
MTVRKMVRLIGPPGCDEANYGTERFVKHEDGHFDVPEEAVEGLCKVGGFVRAPVQAEAAPSEQSSPENRLLSSSDIWAVAGASNQSAGEGGTGADVPPAVDASLGNPDPVE